MENNQKWPNECGTGKSKKKLPEMFPTTDILMIFSKKALKMKINKNQKKTHIDRGKSGGGTYGG